jgi:hypothetical protein
MMETQIYTRMTRDLTSVRMKKYKSIRMKEAGKRGCMQAELQERIRGREEFFEHAISRSIEVRLASYE